MSKLAYVTSISTEIAEMSFSENVNYFASLSLQT